MSLLQDIISKSNIKLHELTVLPLLNCTPWFTTAERIAIGHQPKMNRPPRYFVLSIWRRPSHRTPAASGGARSPRRRRQYAAVAPTLGGGARSRRPHARTLSCVGACSLLCFSSPPNQQEINGSNRMSFHRANPNKHLCDMSKSKKTVFCSFSSKPQLRGLQFHLVKYQIHLTGCIFPQI